MSEKEEQIDHLLDLARMKLSSKEKEEITKDLSGILKYVNQLNEVDVVNIKPMTGGTANTNITKEDAPNDQIDTDPARLVDALSDKKDNYMKIPPVFS